MSKDFTQFDDTDSYTMRVHLSDDDPHPQYIKNTAEAIAAAISGYLQDHPIEVTGVINDLTDVDINNPSDGDCLIFDVATQTWKNQPTTSVGIQDVSINGTSVVIDNVAYIPTASTASYGVVRFATQQEVLQGTLTNVGISPADVKRYIDTFKSTMPGALVVYLYGSSINQYSWSIVGIDTIHSSGELVDNLTPGTYTIRFYSTKISDIPPADRTVTIFGGNMANVVGIFETKQSTVTVNYSNPDITWRVKGTNSIFQGGETAFVDESKLCVIEFINSGNNYNTPENITTAIAFGDNLVFDISDQITSASGILTVTIVAEGIEASDSLKWFVEYPNGSVSGEKSSGESIELPKNTENYRLCFKDVDGYTSPMVQTITVASKDLRLTATGVYRTYKHPVYGIRVIRGNSNPDGQAVIYDRATGLPTVLGEDDSWLSDQRMSQGLTAHDFHRCLLTDDGNGGKRVNYYLDPADSSKKYNGTYRGVTSDGSASVLTGADGDVMVEILPVYFMIVPVGTDNDGRPIEDWIVSRDPFIINNKVSNLHPFFTVGRNDTKDSSVYTQYVGAFESVLCSPSGTGVYTGGITTPNPYDPLQNNRCRSIKGFKPVTNMTTPQFRAAHVSAGLHTMNFMAHAFIELMMVIEYRSLYTRSINNDTVDIDRGCAGPRSDGFVWHSGTWNYTHVRNTGRSDFYGNGTGTVEFDDSDGTDGLSDTFVDPTGHKVVGHTYRGIENVHGHLYKLIDGLLCGLTGYYYSNNPNKYTSDINAVLPSDYTFYPVSWPLNESGMLDGGYVKEFEFTSNEPTFFATKLGGSASTYLAAYFGIFNHGPTDAYNYDVRTGCSLCIDHRPNDIAGAVGTMDLFHPFPMNRTYHGSRAAFSVKYD